MKQTKKYERARNARIIAEPARARLGFMSRHADELARYPLDKVVGFENEGYILHTMPANQLGIHARPAADIAESTSRYDCDVSAKVNGEVVSAKSTIGIMTLGCDYGRDIYFYAKGADAEPCLSNLLALFAGKFGEQ